MIVNRQRRVRVDEEDLRRFLDRLRGLLRVAPENFNVVLVSDARIARLNRRYRRRPGPTDVLSFPAGDGVLGDVVISVDAARRQARQLRHSLQVEIKLLAVHGVLHLLGYDHETDRGAMNRREHALRRRLGLE